MRLIIDDQEINMDNVTYRDIGFGKKIPNYEEVAYRLEMSVVMFTSIIKEEFDKYIDECREDDEQFGDIDEIALMGYKHYDDLLSSNPSLLKNLVIKFMKLEFLRECFKNRESKARMYVNNSIDDINILNNNIIITGLALKKF